jgi:hypothetical protein
MQDECAQLEKELRVNLRGMPIGIGIAVFPGIAGFYGVDSMKAFTLNPVITSIFFVFVVILPGVFMAAICYAHVGHIRNALVDYRDTLEFIQLRQLKFRNPRTPIF